MKGPSFLARRARPVSRSNANAIFEPLEQRQLLTVVSVNLNAPVRTVNNQVSGVNLAWWDPNIPTAQTAQMVKAAGLTTFRFPGGSASDGFHFDKPPEWNGKGTAATFANFIASVNGKGVVTLNYGTGSPQEAAAFLAYLNAPTNSTATTIGVGQEWNDTTSTWVSKDWKTAAFWAGVRAATPLATDDGLNFLRVGRAAPFAEHYYEVGNEEYGSWETDMHGQGGDTGAPHDPATYAAFAKTFANYAAAIDPTISIGIDSGGVGTTADWTGQVLQHGLAIGFVPGFISDHMYTQAPGSESDANLLMNTVTSPYAGDPSSPYAWAPRAKGYRNLLQQTLGSQASKVELLATEFNSVYANPGKQTTSLVNGLFVADSLGSILQTEYNGALVWDLRNSFETTNNNSSSLYGWRQGGDYGLIGSSNAAAPASGAYTPYPSYFAEQLVSKMAHNGDTVVTAADDTPTVSAYAVKQANGHLDVLIINKSPTATANEQFVFQGFTPSGAAQVYQYGTAEDTAQSKTTDGSASLTTKSVTLATDGTTFNYSFPAYSMTLLDLTNGTPVTSPASGLPSGWAARDIGSPASAGSVAVANGTWTVKGGGADIWGTSDQFQFDSRTAIGDTSIVARVTSVQNTNAWAKAGVMFRSGTAANAAYVLLAQRPDDQVAFQWRTAAGQSATWTGTLAGGTSSVKYLKLTRVGNVFRGYYGTDNSTWTAIGSPLTIAMPSAVRAGLAVTAHDNTKLATATFTNVAVAPIAPTKLGGTVIGTTGSYGNYGNDRTKAFDGNLTTYFDAPTASGAWVGLDLGSAKTIKQLRYVPRAGEAARMVGGVFQASNTADFSSGVVTLFTVLSTPADGAWTVASVTNTTAYRYVRYLGPDNGWCDVAEIAFYG